MVLFITFLTLQSLVRSTPRMRGRPPFLVLTLYQYKSLILKDDSKKKRPA